MQKDRLIADKAGGANQSVFLFAFMAYCIATVGWWIQPALVYEVMQRFSVGEARAGLVAALEMSTIAIVSFISARFLNSLALHVLAAFGALCAVMGALLSIFATSYEFLLLTRIVCGAGEGVLLAVATAALAGFSDPDRAYGTLNSLTILLCSAVVFSLPASSALSGGQFVVFPTIFAAIVLFSAPMLFGARHAKPGALENAGPPTDPPFRSAAFVLLALAVFVAGLTSGAMWSFFYLYGEKAGLVKASIDASVGLAAVLSVIGPFLATTIGARFGRLWPISAGMVVLTVAIILMALVSIPLVFRICAVLIIGSTYFLLPYFLGCAAAQDSSGRRAAMISGVFLWTGAAGPFLGGVMMERLDGKAVAILLTALNMVAWLIFVRSEIPQLKP